MKVADYLEANIDKPFTLVHLEFYMASLLEESDREAYGRTYLKRMLRQRFGDAFVVLSKDGFKTKVLLTSGNDETPISYDEAHCDDDDDFNYGSGSLPRNENGMGQIQSLQTSSFPS